MRSLLAASLVALLLPLAASAQALGDAGTGQSFSVAVDPQYPVPYSQATLTTTSSVLDLSNSTLSVAVGGKNMYTGSVQPVAIPIGKAGSVANVQITVTTNGTSQSQSLSIQAQDVSLIAEPTASAPPLYLGKPLVPLEGEVRVVAVANLRNAAGGAIDPAACSYSWTVDDTQIADSSGIGKDALLVASPLQYRARSVSVSIESQDGSAVGGAAISLIPEEPLVRIYRNDPLLGILFDHALEGDYAVSGAEDTLYAAPFSFPTTNGTPTLQWSLDGQAAQTGNSITLRPSGSGQGTASLSVAASTDATTEATADLSLSFGATQGGFNLFGL